MSFSIKLVPGYIKIIEVKTPMKLQAVSYKPDQANSEMEVYVETKRSPCSLLCSLSSYDRNFSLEMNFARRDTIKVQGCGSGAFYLQGSYQLSDTDNVKNVKPAMICTTKASLELMEPIKREVLTTISGLVMCDLLKGSGERAVKDAEVIVHMVGIIPGHIKPFASTLNAKPISCILGKGELIPGLDEGILGMKVGGVRNVTVPSSLGYGPQGYKNKDKDVDIPPNTDLQYEIKLLKVLKPARRYSNAHLFC